jgi:hypothetical protein
LFLSHDSASVVAHDQNIPASGTVLEAVLGQELLERR